MKQDVMSCSAVEPKCPCYAAMEVKEAFMGNPQFKETNYYGAESFSAEGKKKSGCLHYKYGRHSWNINGLCVNCGLSKSIDKDGKTSYGMRSVPFKGNYDAHQAESFEAQAPRGHKMMTKELGRLIPKMDSQDGLGDNAIVYAHYFNPYGIGEWWILEWDGKDEMFGYADLGYPELGYISLSELESVSVGGMELPIERDLHWQQKTLGQVKSGLKSSYGAESHGYSYAYNDGHSDARKREEYRPNLSSTKQESDFKKILKQKAEFSAETMKCFICSKPASNQRSLRMSPFTKDGDLWLCNEHNNLFDFGLFAKGNILAWTHPNGTKYVQGRMLKDAESFDGKRRLATWKEIAIEQKKEYDYKNWVEADKQIDYLNGIYRYLEECTDEEFEDWFINIDQPEMSNFAFDYKDMWGNTTDRDERMNHFGGYINMLRQEQQNMFPDSFYDAETSEHPRVYSESTGIGWAKSFLKAKKENPYKNIDWHKMMGNGEEKTIGGVEYIIFSDNSALKTKETWINGELDDVDWELASPIRIDKTSGKGVYGAESHRDSKGRFTSKSAISFTTAAVLGLVGAYLWRGKN